MQTTTQTPQILLVGGTGKTGRRIAERLRQRGVAARVASRSSATRLDWEDATTWPAALAGIRRVYLTYAPDLAAPAAAERVRAFTDLAASSGVERIVLLSGRGEEAAEVSERTVQESGLEWTILRCSWFSQNFSEDYLLDAVLSGAVALPTGDVLEPFVDLEDVADIATAALTTDDHVAELYELTGPRLLTFEQATREIGVAAGRDLQYLPVTMDDYATALADAGLPPDLISLLTYLFTEVLDGRNASVTDGVERALGRPARDFADYAERAARSAVWQATSAAGAGR